MKNEQKVQFIRPHCFFQIYLRFLEYQMENSNECKKNFVAVYDGSNAIEDLKVIYVLIWVTPACQMKAISSNVFY